MKVLDFEHEPLTRVQPSGGDGWYRPDDGLDLTLCTRCRAPWGFQIIERVEMWKCRACGYEAREKSTDFRRMLLAQQESIIS